MSEREPAQRELTDLVYAAAIDPQRYDELMARWQEHLDAVLAASGPYGRENDRSVESIGEIERHFHRAFIILERLGRQGSETPSLAALIESESRPALLLDAAGKIIAVNARAYALLGVTSGESLASLTLDAAGAANIQQALANMEGAPVGRLLTVTRILLPGDGMTPIAALNRAALPDSAAPVALLSLADIEWSHRIGDMLREVFGLTAAECDIARGIIGGLTSEQLATARDRSVDTVRTQTKSVLRKLELHTQAELIRMVAALMQMDAAPKLMPGKKPAFSAQTTIMRDRGRLLDVITIGPPSGRPVIFIHGMLDGLGVTHALGKGLQARNIRLLCPIRPNFGNSGPDGDAPGAPERFAEDLAVVMDHFHVGSCPVIGHMAGAVYSFAAAAQLGSRITHVINISGGVPITSASQFAFMSARQRIVAHTARYTPRLLPLILRAGIALLDSGGDRAFMKALYRSAPADFAVARTPEVFDLLRDGYRFTVAQGHRAFEIDAHHVVRDWSHYVDASRQPVLLIHGALDPVVDVKTVHALAQGLGERARFVEVPERGQLIFYDAPGAILDAIENTFAERHTPPRV